MLLMVEKDIRSGTFHVVHKFAKAKNKYMKHYDPSTGSCQWSIYMDGKCNKSCP